MKRKCILYIIVCIAIVLLISLSSCSENNEISQSSKSEQTVTESEVSYTIIFDPNGGSIESDYMIVYKNKKIDLPIPVKGTDKFLGWYNKETGELVDSDTNINKSISVIAKWSHYNVTYLNYDGSIFKVDKVTSLERLSPTQDIPNSPNGKEFDKWDYVFGVYIEKDITISPVFKNKLLEIVFMTYDDKSSVMNDEIEYNSYMDLPIPKSYGREFLGWYDDLSIDAKQITNDTVFVSDITLYARWDSYIVDFYDSHNQLLERKKINGFNKIVYPDDIPVSDNCDKFIGWDVSEDTIINSNISVYPLFDPNEKDHSYSRWDIISQPTYITEGLMIRKCTRCGEVENKVIPVKKGLIFNIETKENDIYYTVTCDKEYIKEENVTSITIPSNIRGLKVLYIEKDAFSGLTCLDEVIIEFGIIGIKDRAFKDCSITNVVLPNSITTIGEEAFAGSDLLELIVPSSVKIIKKNAFKGCKLMQLLNIKEGVMIIEEGAFSDCNMIYSLYMPKNIQDINQNAFNNCVNLSFIYFDGTKEEWNSFNYDDIGNERLKMATVIFLKETN